MEIKNAVSCYHNASKDGQEWVKTVTNPFRVFRLFRSEKKRSADCADFRSYRWRTNRNRKAPVIIVLERVDKIMV
jgi:hypothetical protein